MRHLCQLNQQVGHLRLVLQVQCFDELGADDIWVWRALIVLQARDVRFGVTHGDA